MKKLIIISTVFFCLFFNSKVWAQSEAGFEYANDALNFSIFEPFGSTRIQSLGGANTALGGDISNAAGNPAGLGFFNKSEFSVTPTISFNTSKSTFLGSNTQDLLGNFNINNLGFVFSKAKDPVVPGKWRGGTFAITYNTTHNYNTRFKYSGVNDTTSLSDAFVESANGVPYNVLEQEANPDGQYFTWEALAFSTALIDTIWEGPDDEYFSYNELENVRQGETVRTRGAKSQWNFAYGGNYNDRVYFGATLGLASIRHIREKIYQETVLTDNDGYDDLTDFTVNETLTTKGSGINAGAGVILRATDYFRIGASVQTPTYFYSVQSNYDGSMVTNFNENPYNFQTGDGELETTSNNYKFVTPWKLSGGVAFFFNKNGFISADADYITYSKIKLYSSDNELSFNDVNDEIKVAYRSAVNFRVGGEYRVSAFRFRAGYSMYQSGLEKQNNSDIDINPTHHASIGAGMRWDKVYLDFGLTKTFSKNFNYYPYLLSDFTEPEAKVTSGRTKAMVSLGFFF